MEINTFVDSKSLFASYAMHFAYTDTNNYQIAEFKPINYDLSVAKSDVIPSAYPSSNKPTNTPCTISTIYFNAFAKPEDDVVNTHTSSN